MVVVEVASPGLEGGQVAVLHLHAAVSWPRNKDIIFLNEEMYMGLVALFLWAQRTLTYGPRGHHLSSRHLSE